MKKEKRDKDFVHKAFYEGGTAAMKKFISDEMVYPKEAILHKIQGTVKLSFEIDHLGNIHHAKVLAGLGYGCDEEALRLVELMKYQVPKTFKLKVNFQKKINIHFRLKIKKENKTSQQNNSFNYTVTSNKSNASESTIKTGYSYIIKY